MAGFLGFLACPLPVIATKAAMDSLLTWRGQNGIICVPPPAQLTQYKSVPIRRSDFLPERWGSLRGDRRQGRECVSEHSASRTDMCAEERTSVQPGAPGGPQGWSRAASCWALTWA